MRDAYTSIRGYILFDSASSGTFAFDWCEEVLKEYPIKTATGEEIYTHVILSDGFPRVFAPRKDGSYFVRTPVNPVYVMIEGELTNEAVEEAYADIFEWLSKLRCAVKLEDISITICGDSLIHKYRKLEMDTSILE